jgi:hypothetical protein
MEDFIFVGQPGAAGEGALDEVVRQTDALGARQGVSFIERRAPEKVTSWPLAARRQQAYPPAPPDPMTPSLVWSMPNPACLAS